MIQTNSRVNDCTHNAIEALRSITACSCKRSRTVFPAAHWNVNFDHPDLAQTKSAANVLRSCGYRPVTARQISDTIALIFARCKTEGLETVSVPVPFCRATDALLRCPRGLFLTLFGPDGVGKSSISSAAVGALSPLFDHQRTVCWRPQLIGSRIAKEPHKFKLPHDASPHGRVTSLVKITGACLDFFLDHATLTRNQLRGCSLIVWDRYIYDLAVDEKRYRYCGPSWYPDLLLRWLPIPEHFLGIVLDADEKTIFSRKRELTPDELQRQRSAYRRLTACLPETHVVKNDGDFDFCLRRVLSLVINRMSSWFEPVTDELLAFGSAS